MDLDALKLIVKYLLSPLVSCCVLLLVAIACHFTKRLCKLSVPLALAGVFWLVLSSQYAFSNWLLRPLEYRHPVIKASSNDWRSAAFIYTPGCFYYGLNWPEASNWHSCSLTRLTQAAVMARQKPTPIIVTGGRFLENQAIVYAEEARAFLMLLVDSDIIAIPEGKNTQEELEALYQQIGDQPIAVVSAATHMIRIQQLANKTGFTQLIMIPVNHQSPPDSHWGLNIPALSSIYATERALYEYMGLLYLSMLSQQSGDKTRY